MQLLALLISLVLILSPVEATASDVVWLDVPAVDAAEIGIPPAVSQQCEANLQALVASAAQAHLQRKGVPTRTTEGIADDAATVLGLELAGMVAPPGGLWTGSKSVTLRANVTRGGDLLATTVIQAASRGNLFSQVGTCELVERAIRGAAERAAAWFLKAKAREFRVNERLRPLPIAVLMPARFADPGDASETAQKDCAVDQALANRLQTSLVRFYTEVSAVQSSEAALGRRLVQLEILELIAPPGITSGEKSLRVRVKLSEGDRTLGTQEFAFGARGWKSTCSVLDAVARRIAKMTTSWIVSQDTSTGATHEPAAQGGVNP